jgi:prevent-host-death family protein
MTVSVTEFKAKCLNLIDQVQKFGEPLVITKHGKPIVRVIPEHLPKQIDEVRQKLAGSVHRYEAPFEPAVSDTEIEAYK